MQRSHLHFVCEADDRHCLGRGMKRLKQRIARGINRQLGGREGSVFSDRYHMEVFVHTLQLRLLTYLASDSLADIGDRVGRDTRRA